MFRAWGIQKSMFAFAQTPAKPPFQAFKMADIKYIKAPIGPMLDPEMLFNLTFMTHMSSIGLADEIKIGC